MKINKLNYLCMLVILAILGCDSKQAFRGTKEKNLGQFISKHDKLKVFTIHVENHHSSKERKHHMQSVFAENMPQYTEDPFFKASDLNDALAAYPQTVLWMHAFIDKDFRKALKLIQPEIEKPEMATIANSIIEKIIEAGPKLVEMIKQFPQAEKLQKEKNLEILNSLLREKLPPLPVDIGALAFDDQVTFWNGLQAIFVNKLGRTACSMSHMRVIKEIADLHESTGLEYGLIFEDDIVIPNSKKLYYDLSLAFKELHQSPIDGEWDILMLGASAEIDENNRPQALPILGVKSLVKINWAAGNYALLINAKNAKKILELISIDFRPDNKEPLAQDERLAFAMKSGELSVFGLKEKAVGCKEEAYSLICDKEMNYNKLLEPWKDIKTQEPVTLKEFVPVTFAFEERNYPSLNFKKFHDTWNGELQEVWDLSLSQSDDLKIILSQTGAAITPVYDESDMSSEEIYSLPPATISSVMAFQRDVELVVNGGFFHHHYPIDGFYPHPYSNYNIGESVWYTKIYKHQAGGLPQKRIYILEKSLEKRIAQLENTKADNLRSIIIEQINDLKIHIAQLKTSHPTGKFGYLVQNKQRQWVFMVPKSLKDFELIESSKFAITCSPALIVNGQPVSLESIGHDVVCKSGTKCKIPGHLHHLEQRAPRTIVGQDSQGTLHFVVASGRLQHAKGLTFNDMVEFCQKLGFVNAFALDGGGSSAIVIRNSKGKIQYINSVTEEDKKRKIGNAFLLTNPNKPSVYNKYRKKKNLKK